MVNYRAPNEAGEGKREELWFPPSVASGGRKTHWDKKGEKKIEAATSLKGEVICTMEQHTKVRNKEAAVLGRSPGEVFESARSKKRHARRSHSGRNGTLIAGKPQRKLVPQAEGGGKRGG